MPLLMVEERRRSLVYFLVNVDAVAEDSRGKVVDEPWKNAAHSEI